MQLYCMFCGGKLVKSEEGMICFNCNTKFNGIISESEVDGGIERSICMDCFTIKQEVKPQVTVPLQTSPSYGVKAEVEI